MNHLQRFFFLIRAGAPLTDDGLEPILTGYKTFTKIEKAFFSLEDSKVTNKGVLSLLEATKQLANDRFQKFNLDLTGLCVTDEIFPTFKEVLMLLPLNSFGFTFTRCSQITDAGISYLTEPIQKYTSVTKPVLNFGNCEFVETFIHFVPERKAAAPAISNKGLNSILQGLSYLVNMEELELSFHGCQMIDDDGLALFQYLFKNTPQLDRLRLDLSVNPKITDKGVDTLYSATRDLPNLKILVIFFAGCPLVTDTGLIASANAVQGRQLRTFRISVQECGPISDNGVQKFFELMKNNFDLEALFVSFGKTDRLTNNSVKYLLEMIDFLRNLEEYSIRLYEVGFSTSEGSAWDRAYREMKKEHAKRIALRGRHI